MFTARYALSPYNITQIRFVLRGLTGPAVAVCSTGFGIKKLIIVDANCQIVQLHTINSGCFALPTGSCNGGGAFLIFTGLTVTLLTWRIWQMADGI